MKRHALVLTLLLLLTPQGLFGQAPSTARSLGMAGTGIADALGYEAALVNPSRLAFGGFSLTLLGIDGRAGLAPINPSLYGSFLDDLDKSDILSRVAQNGSLQGHSQIALHWLGFSVKNFGLNLYSQARAEGDLPPSMVELLLYGNVGRDGNLHTTHFAGTHARGIASTTVSVGYGRRIPLPLPGRFAAGVTGHYSLIHGLADARDVGSRLVNEPTEVALDADAVVAMMGHAYHLDAGASWDLGRIRAGLVARNLIYESALEHGSTRVYRLHGTLVPGDVNSMTVDTIKFEQLSQTDRETVEDRLSWKDRDRNPLVAAGIAADIGPLTLTGEAHYNASDGRLERSGFAFGVELKPLLPIFRVRAGAKLADDKVQLGTGMSLRLGRLSLDAGVMHQKEPVYDWRGAAQLSILPKKLP